mgnify:CR=1 FL=1
MKRVTLPKLPKIQATAETLLGWYDRHHRELPWRISPAMAKRGVLPNPYHIWMSEVMLQQTTVAAVKAYFAKFVDRWPKVEDLAHAPTEDVMAAWAGLGYYARARNLKKCAEAVAFEHGGVFPGTEEGLRALPGYASDERLPPRFQLLSARIVEPKTIPGDPGSIYMWVEPMDENSVLSGKPRAYRRPYREKEADNLVNALKRSNEGHPQEGRSGPARDDRDWLGPNAGVTVEDGMNANGREPGEAERDEGVEYTTMQAPQLPAKDDQFRP